MTKPRKRAKSLGGSGGRRARKKPAELPTARDTRLLERAVSGRWPIPDELRAELPLVLSRILKSKRASDRNKIAASRVLISADQLNLEQERVGQAGTCAPQGPIAIVAVEVILPRVASAADTVAVGTDPRGEASPALSPGPGPGLAE